MVIIALSFSFMILVMIFLVVYFITKYQKRQIQFLKTIRDAQTMHENLILQSQIEMQEQTFQNISREIHDNIGQKLTLAKLQLNRQETFSELSGSIELISEAIKDLSDISRSMSSELVVQNGLIKALEFEVNQLMKTGIYSITLRITGEPVFLDSNKELIIFRIVQEAINNIIKHAQASKIDLRLYYNSYFLLLEIADNGKGIEKHIEGGGIGMENMRKRVLMLKGEFEIESPQTFGTIIKTKIPYDTNFE
jgi:signal transduction histidine kinase